MFVRGVDKMVTYVVNLLDEIKIKLFGEIITWNTICNYIFIFIISMHKFEIGYFNLSFMPLL